MIGRRWDHGGRTIWTINGKRTTQKEVVSVVKAMNIQTDNLCQFLPQDKVHDFSKMNSKELLAKTVEAVARQGRPSNFTSSSDCYVMKYAVWF